MSQVVPSQPDLQLQVKVLTPSLQAPPLLQGLVLQSSTVVQTRSDTGVGAFVSV